MTEKSNDQTDFYNWMFIIYSEILFYFLKQNIIRQSDLKRSLNDTLSLVPKSFFVFVFKSIC